MTNPPPRKRFQIHLSTAIVMMFVAAGLMWANVTPSDQTDEWRTIPLFHNYAYGWPIKCFWHIYDYVWETPSPGQVFNHWEKKELFAFLDLTIAVIVLFIVWFLCEYLIRRRAARKGA